MFRAAAVGARAVGRRRVATKVRIDAGAGYPRATVQGARHELTAMQANLRAQGVPSILRPNENGTKTLHVFENQASFLARINDAAKQAQSEQTLPSSDVKPGNP